VVVVPAAVTGSISPDFINAANETVTISQIKALNHDTDRRLMPMENAFLKAFSKRLQCVSKYIRIL
jgi:hypothetical protein